MLKDYLEQKGRRVIVTREPGGTKLGERVRDILLNTDGVTISSWAELFLYAACRAQIVEEVIKPALEGDNIVICDRFYDSTVAYQGYGRGLDLEPFLAINRCVTGGITPDITFILDCPPEAGLRRAWGRINAGDEVREDRFERETIEFHRTVREGYLEIAGREPERVKVIDGNREIREVHGEIVEKMEEIIGSR
jgi:dTMP kinase